MKGSARGKPSRPSIAFGTPRQPRLQHYGVEDTVSPEDHTGEVETNHSEGHSENEQHETEESVIQNLNKKFEDEDAPSKEEDEETTGTGEQESEAGEEEQEESDRETPFPYSQQHNDSVASSSNSQGNSPQKPIQNDVIDLAADDSSEENEEGDDKSQQSAENEEEQDAQTLLHAEDDNNVEGVHGEQELEQPEEENPKTPEAQAIVAPSSPNPNTVPNSNTPRSPVPPVAIPEKTEIVSVSTVALTPRRNGPAPFAPTNNEAPRTPAKKAESKIARNIISSLRFYFSMAIWFIQALFYCSTFIIIFFDLHLLSKKSKLRSKIVTGIVLALLSFILLTVPDWKAPKESKTQLEIQQSEIAALSAKLAQVEARLANVAGPEISALKTSLEELQQNLATVPDQLGGLSSQISTLMGKIQGLESSVAAVPTSLELSTAAKDQLTQEILTHVSRLIQAQKPTETVQVRIPEDYVTPQKVRELIESALGDSSELFKTELSSVKLAVEKRYAEILQQLENVQFQQSPSSTGNYEYDGSRDLSDQVLQVIFGGDRGVHMPDYALGLMGGQIVTGKPFTSTTYYPLHQADKSGFWGFFGSKSKSIPTFGPQVILDPSIVPGRCWAFEKDKGNVTVQLIEAVVPKAVTIDHIPMSLSYNMGSSTPRYFRVWGVTDNKPENDLLLKEFVFELPVKRPTQMFSVDSEGRAFSRIKFEILSNHGNSEYTCLYRVRVHGRPVEDKIFE